MLFQLPNCSSPKSPQRPRDGGTLIQCVLAAQLLISGFMAPRCVAFPPSLGHPSRSSLSPKAHSPHLTQAAQVHFSWLETKVTFSTATPY